MQSSRQAVAFVGSGEPVETADALPSSDLFLIGCPDDRIRTCCDRLVASGKLDGNSIVFHLSGALSSQELASAREAGAAIASIHPVKSFADPARAVDDFSDTWCGCEGDAQALAMLEPAFAAIDARLFSIDADNKRLYHAASVIACNYLVALQEVSLRTFEEAGVERKLAVQILGPILHGTVRNILDLDTVAALTGPIARGDAVTVEGQLQALADWNPEFAQLYRQLGRIAADLSEKQGNAPQAALRRIRQLLKAS